MKNVSSNNRVRTNESFFLHSKAHRGMVRTSGGMVHRSMRIDLGPLPSYSGGPSYEK